VILSDLPGTKYWQAFQGSFCGLLQWDDMSMLWENLKTSSEGWYVFDTLRAPPLNPVTSSDLAEILDEIEKFTHKRHRYDYCGFMYVDDRQSPTFIKIFDPRKMGSSCGCSGELILPRWILSRIRPDALPEPEEKKKGFAGWLSSHFKADESN